MAKVYGDEPGRFDEFKKLKNEPFKVKLDYLIHYYGVFALAVVIIVALVASIVAAVIRNSVPVAIHVLVYQDEVYEEDAKAFEAYIMDALSLDPKKNTIDISYNEFNMADAQSYYAVVQKTIARVAAGDLNILISNESIFPTYMDAEDPDKCAFANLYDLYTEEEIRQLESEDRIAYYDTSLGKIPYLVKLNGSKAYDLIGLHRPDMYMGVIINSVDSESVRLMLDAALEPSEQ